MPDVPAISVDMKGTKVLGASLEEIAKAQPKLFSEALGMQAKNIQKSIAAVARNYAIKHKVDKLMPLALVFDPQMASIKMARMQMRDEPVEAMRRVKQSYRPWFRDMKC